jgi:hypothetical protein
MERAIRWWVSLAIIGLNLGAISLLMHGAGATEAMPLLTATPVPTVTATATHTPEFSATLRLALDHTVVAVSEMLTATIDLTVDEGCVYPVYELKLDQRSAGALPLAHIDPPGPVVSSGVAMPFTYTLRAIIPGVVSLRAITYGEKNCDDGWQWRYLFSEPHTVTVLGERYDVWLPVAGR